MNEISQTVILWGAVAGAITGIIALIVKCGKGIKKAVEYFTNLKESVDSLVKHDKTQYMAILRLTVMSENLPLSERIKAGQEYLDNDGNGDVKAYYENNLKPYDHILKGA